MNLSVDEMLRLARKVYPDKDGHIGPDGIEIYAPDKFRRHHDIFNPSLTGEDWQKAQALDCIMAAWALPGMLDLSKHPDGSGFYFVYEDDKRQCIDATPDAPDLFEASARALLGKEQS